MPEIEYQALVDRVKAGEPLSDEERVALDVEARRRVDDGYAQIAEGD
jgi:hypothetical protein